MRTISAILLPVAVLFAVSLYAQEGEEGGETVDPATAAEEISLDPSAPPAPEPGCFSIRRVRNFSGFDNEHLYVEESGSSHFLLTMFRSCVGLRNAQAIAIESHQDRVCSNSQAEITFRGVGGRRESCLIRSVEKVEDRAAARALADIRTVGD